MTHKIVKYLIAQRQITKALTFLLPLSQLDARIVSNIAECYCVVEKEKDAVILLASKIKDFPYLVSLLLKQSEVFYLLEDYEPAQTLAKFAIEFSPGSFEAHYKYAQCLLIDRELKQALQVLNKTPFSQEMNTNQELVSGLGYQAPTEFNPAPFLSLEPSFPDFKPKHENNYTQLMYPFIADLMDEKSQQSFK